MKETKNNGLAIIKANPEVEKLFKDLRIALGAPPRATTKTMGFDTIPIDVVESELDNAFGTMNWKTSGFRIEPMGDAGRSSSGSHMIGVMAFITLHVLHPVLKDVWITREGAIGDYFSQKQIKTKPGALKSMALKNAAQSLGDRFGRRLNRRDQDDSLGAIVHEEAFEKLRKSNNLPELNKAWANIPSGVKESREAKQAYNETLAIIKSSAKQKGGKDGN